MGDDSSKKLFKQRIDQNFIMLMKDTKNCEILCNLLLADKVITRYMLEDICCGRTPSERNCKLYETLPSRGPVYTKIFKALVETGNRYIAEVLLEGLCPTSSIAPSPVFQTPQPPRRDKFFEPLTAVVAKMCPLETSSARGNNKVYKTAVEIYADGLPKTQVGMNELPFVASMFLGYSKKEVTDWQGCPAVLTLDAAYVNYCYEIRTVEDFLSTLDGGGIEMVADITQSQSLVAIIRDILRYPPWAQIPNLKLCDLSENEKKCLAVHLHTLACSSHLSFILRKDTGARPPAYLCYNATALCRGAAVIIRDIDRPLIIEILEQDETNHAASSNTISRRCPFTWCAQVPPSAPWM